MTSDRYSPHSTTALLEVIVVEIPPIIVLQADHGHRPYDFSNVTKQGLFD